MRLAVVCRALGRVGPPTAAVRDPAKFLDIDMDHVAWGVAFVAAVGSLGSADPLPGHRVQIPQPGHARPDQNPGDRPGARAAAQCQVQWPFGVLHALDQNIGNDFRRGGVGAGSWSGAAVLEAVPAVGTVPAEPAVRASPRDAHFLRHVSDGTAGEDALDEDAPTIPGQAGITVGHEDLLVVGCVW